MPPSRKTRSSRKNRRRSRGRDETPKSIWHTGQPPTQEEIDELMELYARPSSRESRNPSPWDKPNREKPDNHQEYQPRRGIWDFFGLTSRHSFKRGRSRQHSPIKTGEDTVRPECEVRSLRGADKPQMSPAKDNAGASTKQEKQQETRFPAAPPPHMTEPMSRTSERERERGPLRVVNASSSSDKDEPPSASRHYRNPIDGEFDYGEIRTSLRVINASPDDPPEAREGDGRLHYTMTGVTVTKALADPPAIEISDGNSRPSSRSKDGLRAVLDYEINGKPYPYEGCDVEGVLDVTRIEEDEIMLMYMEAGRARMNQYTRVVE